MAKKEKLTDLERFKALFYSDRFKVLKGKIEYRSSNLDQTLADARRIIEKYNLNLKAVTEGNMASYGAFEVREITE